MNDKLIELKRIRKELQEYLTKVTNDTDNFTPKQKRRVILHAKARIKHIDKEIGEIKDE